MLFLRVAACSGPAVVGHSTTGIAIHDDVEVAVVPTRDAFLIGEPLWVDVHVRNDGASPVEVSVGDWTGRGDMSVTSPGVYDPWNPVMQMLVGMVPEPLSIPPRSRASYSLDLARWLWIDEPGTYAVAYTAHGVTVDLDLAVRAPGEEEVRAVVTSVLSDQREWQPTRDRQSPDSLGHPLYVPVLESLAHGTNIGALRGLGACPCPEATSALLRVESATTDAWTQEVARELLLKRIPNVAAARYAGERWADAQARFAGRSWRRPEHDVIAVARADDLLADGRDDGDDFAYAMIRQLGADIDPLAVLADLERTLVERPTSRTYGDVLDAAFTLSALPDVDLPEGTTEDARRVVALGQYVPARGIPQSAAPVLDDALESSNPLVLRLALSRLPPEPTERTLELVRVHTRSPDPNVSTAAWEALERLGR